MNLLNVSTGVQYIIIIDVEHIHKTTFLSKTFEQNMQTDHLSQSVNRFQSYVCQIIISFYQKHVLLIHIKRLLVTRPIAFGSLVANSTRLTSRELPLPLSQEDMEDFKKALKCSPSWVYCSLSQLKLSLVTLLTVGFAVTSAFHFVDYGPCHHQNGEHVVQWAFPSGLLAMPTTVSKTPRGRCVNRVKHPLLRLFSTPKWYTKTYFDWLQATIGIIYTV